MIENLANQFLQMIVGGQARNQAQSDHELAEFIRAWAFLSPEERARVMGIFRMDELTRNTTAYKGTRLQRIRRWLASWIYNLVPAFWARRRRKS